MQQIVFFFPSVDCLIEVSPLLWCNENIQYVNGLHWSNQTEQDLTSLCLTGIAYFQTSHKFDDKFQQWKEKKPH